MIDRGIAYFWLGIGLKYLFSANLPRLRKAWLRPIHEALSKHGIRINGMAGLREVVDAFKGRINWRPDPLFQAGDIVLPPLILLDAGGDDCDGSAMLWAQAVDFSLKDKGYKARIVSYLAANFVLSHHICVVTVPNVGLMVIQPPPRVGDDPNLDPLQFMIFASYEDAAMEVASWYKTEVVGFDVRDPMWRVVERWRWLS